MHLNANKQLSELEAEFGKLPAGKPQQTRFLRSQQDLKEKMMAKMDEADGGEAGERGEGWIMRGVGDKLWMGVGW